MRRRETDSQRSKLYAAENAAELETFSAGLWAPLDGSLADAERFARRVVRSRWWNANAPANSRSAAEGLVVESGHSGMRGAWANGRTIRLGPKPRWAGKLPSALSSPPIILHELAHVGTLSSDAPHGREFARLELGLLRRFISPEVAAAYRCAFRERGVRWRAAPSSSARRPGNPAALAAFIPTSDGEWIIAAELEPQELREGWYRTAYGLTISGGQPPVPVWVRNYSTVLGCKRVTSFRGKAQVWKNEATALRWVERFARDAGRDVSGWRVEALNPMAVTR